jgi:3-hydroxyisobutyrate dehydrogenase-like beta-hydroxyacid dehydrogenase
MIGLGKLGLPVALAIDMHGHQVMGYDINSLVMQKDRCSYREQGPNGEPSIEPFLQRSGLMFGSLPEVVDHSKKNEYFGSTVGAESGGGCDLRSLPPSMAVL